MHTTFSEIQVNTLILEKNVKGCYVTIFFQIYVTIFFSEIQVNTLTTFSDICHDITTLPA